MTDNIDITGLSKAQVLAALFNAIAPSGMGFLQAMHGPEVMDVEHAQQLIEERLDFDYLYGRCLKVELADDSFDPWGFDRDNGRGAAQKIIDRLRETGEVNPDESQITHDVAMQLNSHDAMTFANTSSSVDGNVLMMGGDDIGASLVRAVDQELHRHEQ